jgi:hypothetical protein
MHHTYLLPLYTSVPYVLLLLHLVLIAANKNALIAHLFIRWF